MTIKTLNFKAQQEGIPFNVEVEQMNGSTKLVQVFLKTDENSLIELMNKANEINEKTKDISKKYPAINEELSEDNVEKIEEAVKGVTEFVKTNYDELFGEGSYQKFVDAGLSLRKLIPLLDDMSEAATKQLEEDNKESKKKSDKKKANALINKKKKQNK
ncbi:hypothetical protein [Companilactobacillus sp. DQM5]|uniref:hypothetical protein n=1 Tax=Companilactobacillus sp. DQM5 TaxID=3463359 RepID=UPI004058B10A